MMLRLRWKGHTLFCSDLYLNPVRLLGPTDNLRKLAAESFFPPIIFDIFLAGIPSATSTAENYVLKIRRNKVSCMLILWVAKCG